MGTAMATTVGLSRSAMTKTLGSASASAIGSVDANSACPFTGSQAHCVLHEFAVQFDAVSTQCIMFCIVYSISAHSRASQLTLRAVATRSTATASSL